MRKLTLEQFLKDVAGHEMTVKHDDGIYRHLHFANPKSGAMWFDVVTWPGFLAYSGDMGSFVFSRLEDMFRFFRNDASESEPSINPGYWGEKLQAVDRDYRNNSHTVFSFEKFREQVEDTLKDWLECSELTDEEILQLRVAVTEMLRELDEDDERGAREAVCDFSEEVGDETFEFCDTWEWNCQDYTLRYLWCCYAIVWAIQQYDASAAQKKEGGEL